MTFGPTFPRFSDMCQTIVLFAAQRKTGPAGRAGPNDVCLPPPTSSRDPQTDPPSRPPATLYASSPQVRSGRGSSRAVPPQTQEGAQADRPSLTLAGAGGSTHAPLSLLPPVGMSRTTTTEIKSNGSEAGPSTSEYFLLASKEGAGCLRAWGATEAEAERRGREGSCERQPAPRSLHAETAKQST